MIDLGPFQTLKSVDFPEPNGDDFINGEDLLGRSGTWCDPDTQIELPGAVLIRTPTTGTIRHRSPCCTDPTVFCLCDFVQLDIGIPLEFWPLSCLIGASSGAIIPTSAMATGCGYLSPNWGKACAGYTVSASCTTTRIRLFTHFRSNCTSPP